MTNAQDPAVEKLVEYLTTPVRNYGDYGSSKMETPLARRVQQEIGRIASDIAIEVVNGTPGLRERLHVLTRAALDKALRDDTFLRDTVIDSVAKALRQANTPGDD